ncbi:phage tail protein [Pseudomonas iridis]|uniref:phage tail-collar fiber domain-containing protein n=1 Tax=Pseudomonas iridis TaxID=2710587 RepID=UPI0037C57089
MAASITFAGESLKAQKQAAQEVLEIARFVLANVPGLNPSAPINRAAGKPPASQIVYTSGYTRKGYVQPNQVIYSLMMGSDIGDWDFNWIGLETAEGVLFAVSTVPLQQKRKNIPPQQIGNNVTRNILLEFNGAQALTGITVDASTWQHDFTIRFAGVDQRERLSNFDVFGRACFLASGLQMERSFGLYQLKPGLAYVQGVRIDLAEPVQVQLPALPVKVWLDVSLARSASDVVATWKVVFGQTKSDYTDSNGIAHFVVPLASVATSGDITDLRASQPITADLVRYFAARDGDYENLRARATTKDDVELGELPNAKSDDPGTDSSDILATTRCARKAAQEAVRGLVGVLGYFFRTTAPAGWLKANGAAVSRTAYASLFAEIGTTFGSGDGLTTFNLPDVRGEFVRGLDDGRGVDTGRALHAAQGDDNKAHGHTGTISSEAHSHTLTGSTASGGAHTHDVVANGGQYASETQPYGVYRGNGVTSVDKTAIASSGAHTHTITGNTNSVSHSHTLTINSTGTESRPRNIAALGCIKY